MTPLPKRKISRHRQGKRRMAIKLSFNNSVLCPNCQKPKLPHRICPSCGYYHNNQVMVKKEKKKGQSENSQRPSSS